MTSSPRAKKLLALVDLVNKTSQTIINEWEKEDSLASATDVPRDSPSLPSWELYNAQRTILSACGAFSELVHDPQLHLLEMSVEYFEARALHVAAEHRIADILAQTDPAMTGIYIGDLSEKVGIDARKLCESLDPYCQIKLIY